ncbi:YifB family Mg chelatase-like AAA ATPase [Alcanivorax sp. 1008]|uniref:YifB family Mg chelatase-like AAA ATPase n=1 Tax=Alcanivorax sp. 1008 TaxID=2816853 RepID=UPI001E00197D|nr:YifB family Mg chelatase-like AAA ATPase [Alcanivorax sp. 1008]MCC1497373.1 YifB family Mg chelatase-like AAA ATPase [Alcanivorax sp. 1008]
MAISQVFSRAQLGIQAPSVRVETHLGPGLPAFTIVGLPATAVRESRDRVRSAIVNAGFPFPQTRITVNLAPADLPKDGGRFDLPIALGILIASGEVSGKTIDGLECIGELALDGALRGVMGVLPAALACARAGRTLLLPADNAEEASLCRGASVLGANGLQAACAHLKGITPLSPASPPAMPAADSAGPCLSDVRGQPQARRALEIAASGGHSLLLCGPPGSGKSLLASRLPGLLPPLDEQQALDVAAIHSLHRPRPPAQFYLPPFRGPHHTASAIAMVGGGSYPRPGEISMAHHGVLFLDEIPEFDRRVLEVLREPLETGEVSIARAARQTTFPACFQLVAAMNPCPCGYFGDPQRSCGYSCEKARRYQSKLSGPLLDRIDLHLEVAAVKPDELVSLDQGEASGPVRERVRATRQRQLSRQEKLNQHLSSSELQPIVAAHGAWLSDAMQRMTLSARSLHRTLRVARTLADMQEETQVSTAHLAEALSYRLSQP